MQGRLSQPIDNRIQAFPTETWKEEFNKAEKIGFDLIEWIFDSYENPILLDEGINEIKNCMSKSKIRINSVCADFFMDNLLFGISKEQIVKNVEVLKKLIYQCSKLEIKIIELPFVDSSSLIPKNGMDELVENIIPILPLLEEQKIILNLETDLPPEQFSNLLRKFNSSKIKANYDIGNSISNGFDPELEIKLLKDHIFNIHIKDRKIHGNTVSIGHGDVNFDAFFSILAKINYKHDLIIQGAREDLDGTKIEPEQTCSKYLTFVKEQLSKFDNLEGMNNKQ